MIRRPSTMRWRVPGRAGWIVPLLLPLCSLSHAQMQGMSMPTHTPPAAVRSSTSAAVKNLQIAGAWIAAAPPGADELAGYLTIRNPGKAAVTLVGASSRAAAHIMPMRTTKDTAGRESMQDAVRLSIPGGSTLVFAPGQAHLMLRGLARDLNVGEQVEIDLKFSDGSARRVLLTVRRL
ncbi:copper chaperone PCu(A)C [Deinococcus sp. KNUC1210]|uniref:copper chaperone PCu(A)C n=1 Tax=Deinococcus sp. KNUC1210 TaxID=2917691 RepID=UPI001EF0CC27|nr:copper chaperone PCu(A)C [Deinococcus sp. KNUC1210]ULH16298.1 copper chaperone PCu(A)C [Deinococcus sp. KNUC1210]